MHIISSHTNITEAKNKDLSSEKLHDVMVDFEGKIYQVQILAKDTIDAAEKILAMNEHQFLSLTRDESQNLEK